jgi:hypothetical protein
VGNLQAAETLLPVLRVKGCGVSKITVEGSDGLGKDFERFEFIWAEGTKELRGICKREGGVDALHDGSHDLGHTIYELALIYGETEVSVRVINVSLFEVFFDGFKIVKEGIVCIIGGLFREIRFVEMVSNDERRWQLCEVLLKQRGKKCGVSSGDVSIEHLRII